MAYTTEEAQGRLLEALGQAAGAMDTGLAALSEAHEQLDVSLAERLEEDLFRPLQRAYGQTRRMHSELAARFELPAQQFEPPVRGAPSRGGKGFLEDAANAVSQADGTLAELQDSMLPVEVGDASLREGIATVRGLLDGVGAKARAIVRTLGR